jgi:exodeoxyribonuclease V
VFHDNSEEAARDRQAERIVDFDSAIAVCSTLLRLADKLPDAVKARLAGLALTDRVTAHMRRLFREPEFDQIWAQRRLAELLHEGMPLVALCGAAGTGKSHLTIALEAALRASWRVAALAPTNQGANVLQQRGLAARTIHSAIYELGFGPAGEQVRLWLGAAGQGELPERVSLRLIAAWRQNSAGPRERAQKFATNQLTERALRELGLGGGLMDVLPPLWGLKEQLSEEDKLDLALVDEASMVTTAVLDDLRKVAKRIVLIGDIFQLPPVIDEHERARGVGSALSVVPPSHQVHLYTNRRAQRGSEHLRAAGDVLRQEYGLADIERWAREGTLKGLSYAREFDAGLLATMPVLAYYRNTVCRLAVCWRQAAGLPDDALVPGERLIVDSVARDQRDTLTPLGIVKNARLVVLSQTKPYQAQVIAEGALTGLVLTAQQTGLPLSREEVFAAAATVALGVSYPIDELRDAGATLTETAISHGRLAPVQGLAVMARFGAASTTHRAQGAAFDVVQVAADDFYGFARSLYGQVIENDVPVQTWRRVCYTALSRAVSRVIWVREARSYRAAGARFIGESSAAALERSLPKAVRGLTERAQVSELDAALAEVVAASPIGRRTTQPASATIQPLFAGAEREPAAPEPPHLPTSLLAWLSTQTAQLPRQLPTVAPGAGVFTLRLSRTGEVEVVINDPAGRRSGRFDLTQTAMVSSWRGEPLNHADVEQLGHALERLRRGDRRSFMGLSTCGICGRELTDPVSQRFGIGPVCAAKLGITLPSVDVLTAGGL